MQNTVENTKWYNINWLVIVLCILFFPVGLYALWKNSLISKTWKIAITTLVALMVIIQPFQYLNISLSSKSLNSSNDSEGIIGSTDNLTENDDDYFKIRINNGIGVYEYNNTSSWSSKTTKEILAYKIFTIAEYNSTIQGLILRLTSTCEDYYGNDHIVRSEIYFTDNELLTIRKFKDGWYLKESLEWTLWMENRYNPCVSSSISEYQESEPTQTMNSESSHTLWSPIDNNDTENQPINELSEEQNFNITETSQFDLTGKQKSNEIIEYAEPQQASIQSFSSTIIVVAAERAFFYTSPWEESKTQSYCVKGDYLELNEEDNDWVNVSFEGEQSITTGWMKRSELKIITK